MNRVILFGLIALVGTGCISKKKYDVSMAEIATLDSRLKGLQGNVDAARADYEACMRDLDSANEQIGALDALATDQEAKNTALKTKLAEVQSALASLTSRNAADRKAKEELEGMLASLSEEANESEMAAAEARARMVAIEAERAALEAEAQRLRDEKSKLEAKTAAYDQLVDSLQAEIAAGTVKVTELSGKLTVQLSNAILFESGKFDLKADGKAALAKVAGVLAQVTDRAVRVEGHTDNVPVGAGASYRDNWGLSSLRASSVVTLLVEGGVDPLNIAAMGFSEFTPVASNETSEGRAANRRTEIVLVPRLAPKPAAIVPAPAQ